MRRGTDPKHSGENSGSRIPDPGLRHDWNQMVLVGRIARPHGLRGQVVVNPATDFVEERFATGSTVWMYSTGGTEPLTVASCRVQNGRPIVGFEGFEQIEDVERLAGLELRVPEDMLLPLEPGTYYEHQLAGCAVETGSGQVIGTVARVEGGAGASRLVVGGPQGEILIPLAAAICVEIDIADKRVVIDPPEGLLELNDSRQRPSSSRRAVRRRGKRPAEAAIAAGRPRPQAPRVG